MLKNMSLVCGLGLVAVLTSSPAHADPQAQAAAEGKTTYLVFYRSWDATAQAVGQAPRG